MGATSSVFFPRNESPPLLPPPPVPQTVLTPATGHEPANRGVSFRLKYVVNSQQGL